MFRLIMVAVALMVVVATAGCDVNISNGTDEKGQKGQGGNPAPDEGTTQGEQPTPKQAEQPAPKQAPPPDAAPEGGQAPSSAPSAVPAGYILDPHCDKGPGSTGLDIYFLQPPSDSLRFACIHRTDKSPYIDVGDAQYAGALADVGGPYCAYSQVSLNVGCSLTPIAEGDLMNVPPQADQQQPGVPAGYVLEDCQQGVGATGETIYFSPPIPPQGGGHGYWFECVHPAGENGIVNVVSGQSGVPEIVGGNPYCAFSEVSLNVGCSLAPITSQDLMNPS